MRATFFRRFIYFLRDLRAAELYKVIHRYCRGRVLDVGGSDFFLTAQNKNFNFDSWTTLEPLEEEFHNLKDKIKNPLFQAIIEDGCDMKSVESNSYDTLLNIQVLEHVFSPKDMVSECARVLKPGGRAIFLIPQTGSIHLVPNFYYNFSRFWIEKVMKTNGLKIEYLKPLGGMWTTIASRIFIGIFQMFRHSNFTDSSFKRTFLFYPLLPLMLVYAVINIPILMFLGLGDLVEEPNNHLVVVQKMDT